MSTLGDTAFWILTTLAEGRKHGYGVLRGIGAAGGPPPKVTTLYAALERLEQQGLIAPDGEEIVDGRARRYYVIAPDGRARLERETAQLEARARAGRAALARPRVVPASLRAASPQAISPRTVSA